MTPLPHGMAPGLRALTEAIRAGLPSERGHVVSVRGPAIQVALGEARLGARLLLDERFEAEVVAFEGTVAVALALSSTHGLRSGAPARVLCDQPLLVAGDEVLGRILDAAGRPIDGLGPLEGQADWPLRRAAPDPLTRRPVTQVLPTGIRVVDALCPLGLGQRLALQSGPGAGKSTLLSQVAVTAEIDVVVVALIGERGREVGPFVRSLDEVARRRTTVVLARADEPPLTWVRAFECAIALAERQRDDGRNVLLVCDSITRVARALRVIGLAAGEPVGRRGYPASMSTVLSQLLERIGNGPVGTLTGLLAVLVEGDDADDPVAEEVRSLVDGHLVLDPALAGAGRFPAVNIPRSISRCHESVVEAKDLKAASCLRRWVSAFETRSDLLAVGAYVRGSDREVDAFLERRVEIEAFLRQSPRDGTPIAETRRRLLELCR